MDKAVFSKGVIMVKMPVFLFVGRIVDHISVFVIMIRVRNRLVTREKGRYCT